VNGGTTCSNGAVCTGRAGANWPQDGVQWILRCFPSL